MSSPCFFGSFPLNDGINYYTISKQLDPPALQYVTSPVARIPGTKSNGSRINERPITVVVRVVSTGPNASRIDLESKVDALLGALQYRQQRLSLHASDSRYFLCDCVNAPFSFAQGNVLWCDVTCTFVAYTPYAFAAAQSTYSIPSTVMGSISSGTWGIPVQTITGGGNVFNYPTLVITNTGSVQITTVNIFQQTDGMQLLTIQNLNANDTLTVYTNPLAANGLSVLYNNGTPLQFQGAFPVMEPTATLWQIYANAATAPSMSCVWTWVSRFAA